MTTHRMQTIVEPSRRRSSRRRNDFAVAILFLAPATVGFVAFYVWPSIRGLYLSFTDYNIFQAPVWVGLKNYEKLLTDDKMWNSIVVTLEYVAINIVFQTILALLIAVLMQRLIRSTFVRGILLMPYLVSNVVVALVWLWMLDYQMGITNQLLEWIGLPRLMFFGSEQLVIPTIAFVNIWRFMGYTALLIFAGMQSIPNTVYEAARVDGASEWQMFRRITLPLLRPNLAMVVITSMIGSFQVFDTVSVTTQGGPVDASNVIQMYIYKLAFSQFKFGYASAVSVVLMLILLVISIFQLRLTRANSSDLV